jgi:hypothetical protein
MVQSLKTKGYKPGTPVFMSTLVPGDVNGCKGRYVIEVYQLGTTTREIKGTNYDPGSPANDMHVVLSSSQATPIGALIRLTVYLQQVNKPKYSANIFLQQGSKIIVQDQPTGSFVAGQVTILEYDIFCT